MIVVDNVSKYYKNIQALKSVTFNVPDGELFGIIGPDGGGKTTLMRIMVSLVIQDEGKVSLNGLDTIKNFKKVRNIIGYMPGRFSLYMDLTVKENLDFYSKVFGVSYKENYHLIKDVYEQLKPFERRRAEQLSGGMKQKLALCCALIHKPEILFLDEPTTGVDAVSRKEFWDMIYKLHDDGMTIIASTPYMDEAVRCDRIALLQDGNMMTINTPNKIISNFPSKVISIKTTNVSYCIKLLKKWKKTHIAYLFGDSIHLTLKNYSDDTLLSVSSYLIGNNINIEDIMYINPNIEDCYIHLNYALNDEEEEL